MKTYGKLDEGVLFGLRTPKRLFVRALHEVAQECGGGVVSLVRLGSAVLDGMTFHHASVGLQLRPTV